MTLAGVGGGGEGRGVLPKIKTFLLHKMGHWRGVFDHMMVIGLRYGKAKIDYHRLSSY